MWKETLLIVLGFSFGALSAAGVFTVLVAVSLVPRFVGKTHTAKDVTWYETMIVLGTMAGGFYSIFQSRLLIKNRMVHHWVAAKGWEWLGGIEIGSLAVIGLFCGMFVGCLALAIAEMLDSIPIFVRRVGLRKGTGLLVLSVSAGKLVGSFLYFWLELRGW